MCFKIQNTFPAWWESVLFPRNFSKCCHCRAGPKPPQGTDYTKVILNPEIITTYTYTTVLLYPAWVTPRSAFPIRLWAVQSQGLCFNNKNDINSRHSEHLLRPGAFSALRRRIPCGHFLRCSSVVSQRLNRVPGVAHQLTAEPGILSWRVFL